MPSLTRLMGKQFRAQQSKFLGLLEEVNAAKAEMAKVAERLGLLRQLLALEGHDVKLPKELNATSASSRRKVA